MNSQQIAKSIATINQAATNLPTVLEPRGFFYRRVSHESSRKSGLGMEEQLARCEAYLALLKIDFPGLTFAGDYTDPAVSAWSVPFLCRKGGLALHKQLRPGDHVIVAELTRAFRNLKDQLNTIEIWMKQGIHIHFADLRLDLSTSTGRLIINVMGAVAQWYAEGLSERNKAIAARRRLKTGRVSKDGRLEMGRKLLKFSDKYVDVWDEHVRGQMQEVVRLRDVEKLTWRKVADELERQAAEREQRPFRHYANPDRKLKIKWCEWAYRCEKSYQENGL